MKVDDEYLNIMAQEGFEQNNYELSIKYRNNGLYDLDIETPLNFGKCETNLVKDFIRFNKSGYDRIKEE